MPRPPGSWTVLPGSSQIRRGWPLASLSWVSWDGVEGVDRLRTPAGEQVALEDRQRQRRVLASGNTEIGPEVLVDDGGRQEQAGEAQLLGLRTGHLDRTDRRVVVVLGEERRRAAVEHVVPLASRTVTTGA